MGEMGKTQKGLLDVGGYKAGWFKNSEGRRCRNLTQLTDSWIPSAQPAESLNVIRGVSAYSA